jgi:hypothetical protein
MREVKRKINTKNSGMADKVHHAGDQLPALTAGQIAREAASGNELTPVMVSRYIFWWPRV